jgi:sugar phosphate permease
MATPGHRRAMLLLILLSGLIISMCMGLRQSLGLFMRPMTLDLGISAATFGFSIALQNIVWGVSQPFVGALADWKRRVSSSASAPPARASAS